MAWERLCNMFARLLGCLVTILHPSFLTCLPEGRVVAVEAVDYYRKGEDWTGSAGLSCCLLLCCLLPAFCVPFALALPDDVSGSF